MLSWVRIAALGVLIGVGGRAAGIVLGHLPPSGWRSAGQIVALMAMVGGIFTFFVALLGLAIAVVFGRD